MKLESLHFFKRCKWPTEESANLSGMVHWNKMFWNSELLYLSVLCTGAKFGRNWTKFTGGVFEEPRAKLLQNGHFKTRLPVSFVGMAFWDIPLFIYLLLFILHDFMIDMLTKFHAAKWNCVQGSWIFERGNRVCQVCRFSWSELYWGQATSFYICICAVYQ